MPKNREFSCCSGSLWLENSTPKPWMSFSKTTLHSNLSGSFSPLSPSSKSQFCPSEFLKSGQFFAQHGGIFSSKIDPWGTIFPTSGLENWSKTHSEDAFSYVTAWCLFWDLDKILGPWPEISPKYPPPLPPGEVVAGTSSPNSMAARFSGFETEIAPKEAPKMPQKCPGLADQMSFRGKIRPMTCPQFSSGCIPPLPRGRWWRGFLARKLGPNLPFWGNLSPFDPEKVLQFLEILWG